MCLNTCVLSLEPQKFLGITRYWYGTGYKAIHISRYGFACRKYRLNRWQSARFSSLFEYEITTRTARHVTYHPGFHVFLDRESAIEYDTGYEDSSVVIVPVYFRNVIAFGTNFTGSHSHRRYDDCVIAQKIYIAKKDFYNPQNLLSCIKTNLEPTST